MNEVVLIGAIGVLIVMTIVFYIVWLRLKIWYLNQFMYRTTVMIGGQSPEANPVQEKQGGCLSTILLTIILSFVPIAILMRLIELI